MQEGLWNLSFFVDKDSILIKVWIFKNYMDSEMINPWTQVKSYHGHFEISQTPHGPMSSWRMKNILIIGGSYNELLAYNLLIYIITKI